MTNRFVDNNMLRKSSQRERVNLVISELRQLWSVDRRHCRRNNRRGGLRNHHHRLGRRHIYFKDLLWHGCRCRLHHLLFTRCWQLVFKCLKPRCIFEIISWFQILKHQIFHELVFRTLNYLNYEPFNSSFESFKSLFEQIHSLELYQNTHWRDFSCCLITYIYIDQEIFAEHFNLKLQIQLEVLFWMQLR